MSKFVLMFTVLLHLAEEAIVQDLSLGLSYLLALPNVSVSYASTFRCVLACL